MIRSIFRSGTFAEGWAVYAEQVMAERGYGGPEVRMQQLKMKLRTIINAIIDQKIHTAGMTEQEAMSMMMNEGFQEEGEAAGGIGVERHGRSGEEKPATEEMDLEERTESHALIFPERETER